MVRGGQQRNITTHDTHRAMLAGKSFRLLIAIVVHKDLELRQFDVKDVFVHTSLDRDVLMQMPYGYQRPGTILTVNKALYGLQISPALWYKEFTTTLASIGFERIPHEARCVTRGGIVISFHVDDIICAFPKGLERGHQNVTVQIKEKYSIAGGEGLHWFLGLELIRDRVKRTIGLSRRAYTIKISNLVDNISVRHDTPMGEQSSSRIRT